MDPVYKLPRLYVETLSASGAQLADGQWHYLRNVLRCKKGDGVRLFNERMGEYRAVISDDGKRPALDVRDRLREPQPQSRAVHLYVPPLPKDRMDFLIEKTTELGMTDYHPLLSERAAIRNVNEARLRAQAIEAIEQCERLDAPRVHAPTLLARALSEARGTVLAALERLEERSAPPTVTGDLSIFIGPPGGWSDAERALLTDKAAPLDLGATVLRAETAALVALARIAYP